VDSSGGPPLSVNGSEWTPPASSEWLAPLVETTRQSIETASTAQHFLTAWLAGLNLDVVLLGLFIGALIEFAIHHVHRYNHEHYRG